MMSTCVFCQLVNGEIPMFKLYEDEHVVAFLDISQTTKGHTLIIPKGHTQNLLEVEAEAIDVSLMKGIRIVCAKLQKTLQCQGFNIVSNINEIAGQVVFHTHIHIIPRYRGKQDGFEQKYTQHEVDFLNLEQLHKQIMEVV